MAPSVEPPSPSGAGFRKSCAQILVKIGRGFTALGRKLAPTLESEQNIQELIDQTVSDRGGTELEAQEREMIHSVVELAKTPAREVMVPRTDVEFVGKDQTLDRVMELFLTSGFSRIPVIGENEDQVLGIIYLKDAASELYANPQQAPNLLASEVMREVRFVPASKPVDDLLREMQSSKNHIAIVVDEYGGTAGLVTIEDILEEIVGEITDEYDPEDFQIQELGVGEYRVSARLSLEDLGDLFGVEIQDADVDTVGGLLTKSLGNFPQVGDHAVEYGLELVADAYLAEPDKITYIRVQQARNTEIEVSHE